MIVLMGYSISKVLLGMLFVSLAVLILIIIYKKILARLGKGIPLADDYCVLYGLEKNPVEGELEIYFTTKSPRNVVLEILNEDLSVNFTIIEKEFPEGGHIVRFDSKKLPNGYYFYCLRSENQKTMKKMEIRNV